MPLFDREGNEIVVSAGGNPVVMVVEEPDDAVNKWPNPLEVYRRNEGHFVIPNGTEAVGGYLNAASGAITDSSAHSCWTAELEPGRSIEVAGFTGNTTYCFFDESETFISGANVSANTVATVTPPGNAKFIKVSAKTWSVRTSTHSMPGVFYADAEYWSQLIPNPRSLVAKLNDPAYAHLNIVFSGDSNTAGAGLTDIASTWCNLIGEKLQTLYQKHTAYRDFLVGANCKNSNIGYGGGYIEFDFNGKELEVFCTTIASDSGASTDFDVYVDGELYQTITISGESAVLTFPDYTRKRLKFCNNTSVHALAFRWTPIIEYTNVALSGANNITMPTTGIENCDLFIFMIGTNDRGGISPDGGDRLTTIQTYKDKCIAILPPPRGYDEIMTNGKDSSVSESASWTSEANIHATYSKLYSRYGITYIDISTEMAMENARHYQTMLQDDLLHFSEEGHKILANVISAKLGVPTYYKLEAVTA